MLIEFFGDTYNQKCEHGMLVCDNCKLNKSQVKEDFKNEARDLVRLIESTSNQLTIIQAIKYYRGLKSTSKIPVDCSDPTLYGKGKKRSRAILEKVIAHLVLKDVLQTCDKKNGMFRSTVLRTGRQSHFARDGKIPCLISIATKKKGVDPVKKKKKKKAKEKKKKPPAAKKRGKTAKKKNTNNNNQGIIDITNDAFDNTSENMFQSYDGGGGTSSTNNRNNNRSNLNNNTKAKPVYDVFGSEDDEESDDEVQHYSQTNEELLEIRLKDVGMRKKLERLIKKIRGEFAKRKKTKVFNIFGNHEVEKMAKYVPTDIVHFKHPMFKMVPNIQKMIGPELIRSINTFIKEKNINLVNEFPQMTEKEQEFDILMSQDVRIIDNNQTNSSSSSSSRENVINNSRKRKKSSLYFSPTGESNQNETTTMKMNNYNSQNDGGFSNSNDNNNYGNVQKKKKKKLKTFDDGDNNNNSVNADVDMFGDDDAENWDDMDLVW